MRAFVDEHRENFGVEPICKVLQVVGADVDLSHMPIGD